MSAADARIAELEAKVEKLDEECEEWKDRSYRWEATLEEAKDLSNERIGELEERLQKATLERDQARAAAVLAHSDVARPGNHSHDAIEAMFSSQDYCKRLDEWTMPNRYLLQRLQSRTPSELVG